MSKEYDYLVFIGRFQPLHNGHTAVLEEAFKHAEHVIVLVGSADRSRSWRNPFTFEERRKMILEWAWDERLSVCPLNDYIYNEQGWLKEAQNIVSGVVLRGGWKDKTKIGLIGREKDHTGYYLSLFPQWGHVDVPAHAYLGINATDIRKMFFDTNGGWIPGMVEELCPGPTVEFLDEFRTTDEFKRLKREHEYIEQYKIDHAFAKNLPYDPIHLTTDAVVVQAGHVLLVRRGTKPGEGLMALPGGFVKRHDKITDSMIRELREETKLKVPEKVLRGCIKKKEVYDDPHRSDRGRIVTHAYLIELPPDPNGLPKVKGGSDVAKAFWYPISDLKACELFEDHWHIINHMLGTL